MLKRFATMTHYFFHLSECGVVTTDYEGRKLDSLAAARASALRDARDIMATEVQIGKLCLTCHIDIVDAGSAIITRVLFRDALEISGL